MGLTLQNRERSLPLPVLYRSLGPLLFTFKLGFKQWQMTNDKWKMSSVVAYGFNRAGGESLFAERLFLFILWLFVDEGVTILV